MHRPEVFDQLCAELESKLATAAEGGGNRPIRDLAELLVTNTLMILGITLDQTRIRAAIERVAPEDLKQPPATNHQTVDDILASVGYSSDSPGLTDALADPLAFALRNAFEVANNRLWESSVTAREDVRVIDLFQSNMIEALLLVQILRNGHPYLQPGHSSRRWSLPMELQKPSSWASGFNAKLRGKQTDKERKETIVSECLMRPSLYRGIDPPRPTRDDLMWLTETIALRMPWALQSRDGRIPAREWAALSRKDRLSHRPADTSELVEHVLHVFSTAERCQEWQQLPTPDDRARAVIRLVIQAAGNPEIAADFFNY
jgi:hypothetical protein